MGDWSYSAIENYRGFRAEPGELSVNVGGAAISTSFSDETGYSFVSVLGDPTGNALGKYLDEFIIIRINDSSLLNDSLAITYRYSGESLQNAGINASYLRPYVYDWDMGEYLPVGKVTNIPLMNMMIFSLDPVNYPDMRYLVIGFFESNEPTAGATVTVTTTLTKTSTSTVTATATTTSTVTVSGEATIKPTTITETSTITTTLLETTTTTLTTGAQTMTQTLTETIEKTVISPTTVTETTTLPGQTITITQTETQTEISGMNPTLIYVLIAIIILLIIALIVVFRKK